VSYVLVEAFNNGNFILSQTMIQRKMKADSVGIIIGIQGLSMALSLGIFVPLIGFLYDTFGRNVAFLMPLSFLTPYVISLFVLIIYRRNKKYDD
jgi:hypothetical protein